MNCSLVSTLCCSTIRRVAVRCSELQCNENDVRVMLPVAVRYTALVIQASHAQASPTAVLQPTL